MVEGYLELSLRLAEVHGQTSPLAGAAALLGVAPAWRIGGAAHAQLQRVDIEIPPALQALELHLGYAGLLLERRIRRLSASPGSERTALDARLLIGGGNAEVRDAATGARLRSDNFAVLEPTLSVHASLTRRIAGGLAASYRMVGGVDGLQGIEEENLRGWSIGLTLGLGPF